MSWFRSRASRPKTCIAESRVFNDVVPIVEYLHLQKDNYEMRRPKRGAPLSIACSLKNELRLQFDHPWRCIRTQTRAIDGGRLTDGLGDLSELAAVDVGVWEGKVRMIEEIKEPRANREPSSLPSRYREGLFYVEISVEVTWATKLVTRRIL